MGFDDLKLEKQMAIEMLVLGDPQLPGKPMKYGEIAERVGVAEFTLRRWRAEPEFEAAKKEFRDRIGKSTLVDEAIQTLRRSMRSKDSTHAAEVVLKFAGEMVNINKTEVSGNVTQQIDVRDSSTQALMERMKELHKQLGLPDDVQLYIGQGQVIDAEIVGEDDVETAEKEENR